jgi:hypothetical protein
MTVIVYKDRILATDTAVFAGDTIVGYGPKIQRSYDYVWASCGSVAEVQLFDRWALRNFLEEERPAKSDNFGAIIVNRVGNIYRCAEPFILYDVTKYQTPHVDGAAGEYIHGLLDMGASAILAVEMAIKRCNWAGGIVSAFDCATWNFI